MKKSEAISRTLLNRIRQGVYSERIPSRERLASEFDVNFKTANKAVSLLVERGLVYRKRGEGAFVVPRQRRDNVTIGLAFNKYIGLSADPVFQSLFFGINMAIKAEGCRLDISAVRMLDAPANTNEREHHIMNRSHFLKEVQTGDPDGIILLGTLERAVIETLMTHSPVVAIGQVAPGLPTDNVRRDVRGGVADAVRLFASRGHERIAYVTYNHGDEDCDLIEKEAGYIEATQSLGLPYAQIIRQHYFNIAGTLDKLLALEPRPTAVVAAESTLGLSVLRHAPERAVRIPRDLAIIAFDDGHLGLTTNPPMSSLQAFGGEIGELAVETLLQRLDNKATKRMERVLPCELVERESSMPE